MSFERDSVWRLSLDKIFNVEKDRPEQILTVERPNLDPTVVVLEHPLTPEKIASGLRGLADAVEKAAQTPEKPVDQG